VRGKERKKGRLSAVVVLTVTITGVEENRRIGRERGYRPFEHSFVEEGDEIGKGENSTSFHSSYSSLNSPPREEEKEIPRRGGEKAEKKSH